MHIHRLDHVNVRTAQLDTMRRWYAEVLGFVDGARPAFPFGGAWLYAGDHALVHLVEVNETTDHTDLKLEHFAFSAEDKSGFLNRLDSLGVESRVNGVPGTTITQVNIWDPDGNHIHVDFDEPDSASV